MWYLLLCSESTSHALVDEQAMFANNELGMRHNFIDVYGFDYDYTLALYTNAMHFLIYDLAVKELINTYGYPQGIVDDMKYDPDFAIRGLHFDTCNERGNRSSRRKEPGPHWWEGHVGFCLKGPRRTMHQMIDLFSYPEMVLLSSVIEVTTCMVYMNVKVKLLLFFLFFRPWQQAVQNVHRSGKLYQTVMNDIDTYLKRSPLLGELLHSLGSSGKMLFLITNSGFEFVKKGMDHMLGKGWRDLFDIIITQARKPSFYHQPASRPFRCMDTRLHRPTWQKVSALCKGQVYMESLTTIVIIQSRSSQARIETNQSQSTKCQDESIRDPIQTQFSDRRSTQRTTLRINFLVICKLIISLAHGNIDQFMNFTGWFGPNVLYLGDHVYSDLRDPVLHHGWRTGAIIPELEAEIRTSNSADFQHSVMWLSSLQDLIIQLKSLPISPRQRELKEEWKQERRDLRWKLKALFNPRFGSVFRTYNNSTYFTRRLVRFADLYMSSVENLLRYPSNYTFYPRRIALPHEAVLDFRTTAPVSDQQMFPP
ncbi:LOW QUALITY PROTEIN: 5'-nucleotidase domain-containing protein 2-like [Acropora millepora]|uniref:LOW QUALITY PROTEIN: 5'-nucleotidase domain-containing protein 2-like n=1 Tax=Acropora millepora TaxID=45264 RepID=UPI001CF4F5BF|nr:LOW QUALITY PROTEIN: 5'-nucleotidase domain-containing protein 2-like [Acropora millepora]